VAWPKGVKRTDTYCSICGTQPATFTLSVAFWTRAPNDDFPNSGTSPRTPICAVCTHQVAQGNLPELMIRSVSEMCREAASKMF
jgi:hypothetical protein